MLCGIISIPVGMTSHVVFLVRWGSARRASRDIRNSQAHGDNDRPQCPRSLRGILYPLNIYETLQKESLAQSFGIPMLALLTWG